MLSNSELETRELGKTGIMVTPVGLGVMELAGGSLFPALSPGEKNAIIKAALDGGINWFDTAEIYGGGVSEAALASGLKAAGRKAGDVVIATKWWPLLTNGGQYSAQHFQTHEISRGSSNRPLLCPPTIQFLLR